MENDLESYFGTIPHDRLPARVGQKISDGRILGLIKMFLEQGVMEGLSTWTPEEGTPQGAIISPLLLNIYLDPLDHLMLRGGEVSGSSTTRFARRHAARTDGL
ncbi:MAG: hypothetical protein KatS3mg110_3982 [Pirellulaceae bacterium]|nr:MAG: hypothetical protein KatS3mg110_3982 [Pirellulaceae bacterium]